MRIDPNEDGLITLAEYSHWVAPPQDLPTLVAKLLAILHETYDGGKDDFYDALDKDGDERLSKAELVNRLASQPDLQLVLSDLEVDALMLRIDGDIGNSDGLVSREWRALLNGESSALTVEEELRRRRACPVAASSTTEWPWRRGAGGRATAGRRDCSTTLSRTPSSPSSPGYFGAGGTAAAAAAGALRASRRWI